MEERFKLDLLQQLQYSLSKEDLNNISQKSH